jgi:single-strand DNA-binding protein
MNKVILCGRLTREPEVRYSQTANGSMAVARYTLAVDRKFKKEGEQNADFINCIAFGKSGEFAEKYFFKGIKIAISGRIQTGSYTNKDGQRVYTTDVVVEEQEFCESKQNQQSSGIIQPNSNVDSNGFMSIPYGVEDEGLPFN